MDGVLEFEADDVAATADDGNGVASVWFANAQSKTPRYVTVARYLEELGEPYVERDDQCWGSYGGIIRAKVVENVFMMEVTERTAAALGGVSAFRVSFRPTDLTTVASLRDALHVIFGPQSERLG